MSSQPAAVPRKLPFWQTVAACYVTVGQNFGQLVRISWLWLLIMLPVYAAVYWLIWLLEAGADKSAAEQAAPASFAVAVSLLPNLVELPALASIAVAWHRLVLREETVRSAIYLRLDSAVWRYALVVLALLLLGYGPFLLIDAWTRLVAEDSGLAAVWMFVAIVVAGFGTLFVVLPRLSLVLPAIALGDPLSPAGAWRASRGNTWRLAGATLLCTLPPAMPVALLAWLAEGSTRASSTIASTLSSLVNVLIVTIAVTLLSLAYRHLVSQPQTGPATPA